MSGEIGKKKSATMQTTCPPDDLSLDIAGEQVSSKARFVHHFKRMSIYYPAKRKCGYASVL